MPARSSNRTWPFTTFILLLVLLHLLFRVGFGAGALAPDLMAVAVLITARRSTATRVVVLAVLLGIVDDVMGIRNLGMRSIALGSAALLVTWSRNFIEGEGLLFVLAYLFVGKWVSEIVLAVLASPSALDALTLITWAPLAAAWTAIAGTLALMAFRSVAGPDA
jgi:hypothetical protein